MSKEEQIQIDKLSEKIEEQDKYIAVTSNRMDNIDQKLERLADAVISIARAEEKITSLVKDYNETQNHLELQEKRINEIEKDVSSIRSMLSSINKFGWFISTIFIVLFSALISFFIGVK